MRSISFILRLISFFVVFVLVCIISLYTFAYLSPKIELRTANKFSIFDKYDNLVFQGSGSHEWVPLSEISPYVIDAFISTEDRNFYRHNGFDYLRIAKTMFDNLRARSITAGASTISQQFVKNMFLTFDQTWRRKIEEAFLTLKLELHYSKDEILEGYLNTIYYGNGQYGIANASSFYFNKAPMDLTLEEAIILAGIPRSPNNFNPLASMDNAINRGRIVANAMVRNDKLDSNKLNYLFQEELEIHGRRDNNNMVTLMYYQNAVISELRSITGIPNSLIESGGIRIYTNLSLDAQRKMEEAIINNMSDTQMQVASIIIEPSTGRIRALAGGKDYAKSQFNRATMAERQVGSAMKPFLYYAALENNLVSSSRFLSAPTTFKFANNQTYSPSNAHNVYGNKEITMAAALAYSDNIFAVKTHLFLGKDQLVDIGARMGIRKPLKPIPSLPLGTIELSMMDFATAYTTLASGGFKKDLYFIRKVTDMNGNILYKKNQKKDLVLDPNKTFILNQIMNGSLNPVFVDYHQPTSLSIAGRVSRKYASKTGSTGTDFWMVGYNPDLLMLVWNGMDDGSHLNPNDGGIVRRIWVETMEAILENVEPNWYEKPPNIVGIPANPITGEFGNTNRHNYIFYYIRGTEPFISR